MKLTRLFCQNALLIRNTNKAYLSKSFKFIVALLFVWIVRFSTACQAPLVMYDGFVHVFFVASLRRATQYS